MNPSETLWFAVEMQTGAAIADREYITGQGVPEKLVWREKFEIEEDKGVY
jgi:hypothetical protein